MKRIKQTYLMPIKIIQMDYIQNLFFLGLNERLNENREVIMLKERICLNNIFKVAIRRFHNES